jgi:beta-glucanase (GH16 family)
VALAIAAAAAPSGSAATHSRRKLVTARASAFFAAPGNYALGIWLWTHHRPRQSVTLYVTGQHKRVLALKHGSATHVEYVIKLAAATKSTDGSGVELTARAVSSRPAVSITMHLERATPGHSGASAVGKGATGASGALGTTGASGTTGTTGTSGATGTTGTPGGGSPPPAEIVNPQTGACLNGGCAYTTPIWGDNFDEDDTAVAYNSSNVFDHPRTPGNDTPDASIWSYQQPGADLGCGGGTVSTFGDSTTNGYLLPGGGLAISAIPTGNGQYSSAELATGDHAGYQYGSVQASIWVPAGVGLCSGFWMAGDTTNGPGFPSTVPFSEQCGQTSSGGWPTCGETDVVEVPAFSADPNDAYFDIHGPMPSSSGQDCQAGQGNCQQWEGVTTAAGQLSSGYHTFGVVWSPGSITWTLDGIAYDTITEPQVAAEGGTWEFDNGPQEVFLDLAVGGWPEPGGPPTSSTQTMVVQWVHWYQDCAAGAPGTGCP